MNSIFIIQFFFNIFILIGLFILFKKLTQKPLEDPRLSRGLQLLQSKISILEDLSNRTDLQVEKLMQLLEQKTSQVQRKLHASDKQIQQLEISMKKSRDVASLFEDKIPHSEIIERESSVKYIKAAQMAYNGKNADEITSQLNISKGEAEFIVKVNKDELMFDETQLPEWAKVSLKKLNKKKNKSIEDEFSKLDISFEEPKKDFHELKKLGASFRKACKDFNESKSKPKIKATKPKKEIKTVTENINKNFIPIKNIGIKDLEFKEINSPNKDKT